MRFKAGSVEPAHHHTHGHDVIVIAGCKTVENLTTGQAYELEKGSYLYTAVRAPVCRGRCKRGSMAVGVFVLTAPHPLFHHTTIRAGSGIV